MGTAHFGESKMLPVIPAINKPVYNNFEAGMLREIKFVFIKKYFSKDGVGKSHCRPIAGSRTDFFSSDKVKPKVERFIAGDSS